MLTPLQLLYHSEPLTVTIIDFYSYYTFCALCLACAGHWQSVGMCETRLINS